MYVGAETTTRLAGRVHMRVVSPQPCKLLALLPLGSVYLAESPTCSSWDGILGNSVLLYTQEA